MHIKFEVNPDEFLCHLTEAAYRSVLKHGIKASFLDVEMDLQHALRGVMAKDVVVSESCGSGECLAGKKTSLSVWSKPAKKLFRKEA